MKRSPVRARLMRRPVRRDGSARPLFGDRLAARRVQGRRAGLCTEIAGGPPTPRGPAQIAQLARAVESGSSASLLC